MGSVSGLSPEAEQGLAAEVAVLSGRFEVLADADYKGQRARLKMIVERDAQGQVTILWRRSEP